MMVIEDNGMYILYNDNGRCLSSGENLETLENAIDRYAKKAAGKRHRFEDMVNYTDSFSARFMKHEQLVKELWAQKFAYKYEDWLEGVIHSRLDSYKSASLPSATKIRIRKKSAREESQNVEVVKKTEKVGKLRVKKVRK